MYVNYFPWFSVNKINKISIDNESRFGDIIRIVKLI